jgi:lysophospholipase L1-like esterase
LRHVGTALTTVVLAALAMIVTGCTGSAAGSGTAPDGGASRAAQRPPPSYYLSLGDSLARGVQPDSAGASLPTAGGYPELLHAALRRGAPGLRLVKLGCSGETSATMIHGGICRYRDGSQLAAAEQFLRAHRGRVSLVTIDIGANDPNSCFAGSPLTRATACVGSRIPRTAANLRTILSGLRAAGGSHVKIIGMSYYVPELAAWVYGGELDATGVPVTGLPAAGLTGAGGKVIAALTERLVAGYNALLGGIYHHYDATVADVFAAFRSSDFTGRVRVPRLGMLPPNVAAICTLTWACTPAPRGPNEHPNDRGYATIAAAFQAVDPQ